MLEYKEVKIDEVKLNKNNPRLNEEASDKLVEGIEKFGFINPIIVNKKDNLVLAGHTRIKAMKKLGRDTIPAIFVDMDEATAKGFSIFDNKSAEFALWDEDLLKVELEALKDMDFDLEMTGFDMSELDELNITFDDDITPLDESKADEVPEVDEDNIVIKRGDLIELGHNYQHRLLCGDSTSEDDVKRLMNGVKADMVFTDPPYNIGFKGTLGCTSKNGKIITMKQGYSTPNGQYEDIKNDKKSEEEFRVFIERILDRIKENNNGGWYICFASSTIHELLLPLIEKKMKWKSIIIWNKNQSPMGGGHFRKKYEPIVYGYFNNFFYGKEYAEDDVWDITRTLKNDLHPTMKPIPLIEKAVNYSSKKLQVVLDLFLGSGSTLIACENLSRKCYGMELDEKYCQVIIQRYVDYTSNPKIKINGVEVDWYEYKEKAN